MAKMTIAQCREREVNRLAELHKPDPGPEDIDEARRLMNSYYRLCGLCDRNLYLTNDDYTCNKFSTKRSEERESNWYKRLNKEFEEFAGVSLVYCSWYPSIGIKSKYGGFERKIHAYFYS